MKINKSQTETLKVRLEGLKETSQNPNIDELLEKVTDRAIKHEKLFDEIIAGTVVVEGVRQSLQEARGAVFDAVSVIPQKFEGSEQFARRLEAVMEKQEGSYLKPIRTIEIIDRLETKISKEAGFKLNTYRNDLLDKAKIAIEGMIVQSPEAVSEVFKVLPGDQAVRGKILTELEGKFEAPQIAEQFGKIVKEVQKLRPAPYPVSPTEPILVSPSGFNLVFRYGVGAVNELDTFKQTYTKDMVMNPPVTIKFKLSDGEFLAIYQKIKDLNLFDDRTKEPTNGFVIVTPCSSYYLKVQIDSDQKELSWNNCRGKINDRLQQFTDYIISIIESKEEYKKLPAPRGGYL